MGVDYNILLVTRVKENAQQSGTRAGMLSALHVTGEWAMRLGQPPADPDRRAEWLRQLDTIATYRDRWQVKAGTVLGGEPQSPEQLAHRQAAQHAVSTALSIAHPTHSTQEVHAPAVVMEPEVG